MENEVVNRLNKVSESIVYKNEKLKAIKEKVVYQKQTIDELTQRLVKERENESQLDDQIREETSTNKQYQSRNFQLSRELGELKIQISNSSKQLHELTEISKECFVLMLLENDQMESHCNHLDADISKAHNLSLMSTEDLLSTLDMRNELSKATASSTKVEFLKKQLASVRKAVGNQEGSLN